MSKPEFEFLSSLVKENVGLLNTIFDAIKLVEDDGKLDLHDLPIIINTIITVIRVFLIKEGIYTVPLLTVVKFLVDTLVANDILSFKNGVDYEQVKRLVRTTLAILNTDVKIKPPKVFLPLFRKLKKLLHIA
jgi:hypothetical protein